MSKKAPDVPAGRPVPADPSFEPIGIFAGGKRLTTPCGDLLPPRRPISRVASRLRSIEVGACTTVGDQPVDYVPVKQLFKSDNDSPQRRKARGLPSPALLEAQLVRAERKPCVAAADVLAWAEEAGHAVQSRLHSRSQSRTSVSRSISRAVSRGGMLSRAASPGYDLFDSQAGPSNAGSWFMRQDSASAATHPPLPLPRLVETPTAELSSAIAGSVPHRPVSATLSMPPVNERALAAPWGPTHAVQLSPAELTKYYLGPDSSRTLLHLPWSVIAIDNDRLSSEMTDVEGSVCFTRAAQLSAAVLDLKRRIEVDETVLMPRTDAEPLLPVHTARFYDALCGNVVLCDEAGTAALRNTEGACHFIISYGRYFYEVPACDSHGRSLVASEVLAILRAVRKDVDDASSASGSQRIPVEWLTRFDRGTIYTLQADMQGACLVNGRTLRALNRALFHIVIADPTMTPPTNGPVLGLDGASATAQWIPSALTLVCYPAGDTIIRANALVCPIESLVHCGAWIANAAATDPMIAPPRAKAATFVGTKKTTTKELVGLSSPGSPGSRAQTPMSPPTPAGGKRGKASMSASVVAEEPSAAVTVQVTLPSATVDFAPKRAPAWMPEGFKLPKGARLGGVAGEGPEPLANFDATAHTPAALYLATVLAAAMLDLQSDRIAGEIDQDVLPMPNLYSAAGTAVPCQRDLRLCRNEAIDSAVAHLGEMVDCAGTGCGPLRSSVVDACAKACESIAAIHNAPPYASLVPRGTNLPAPTIVVSMAPQHRLLQWALETTRWPTTVPLVSFVPLSTHRSNLRRQVGTLYTCTVIGSGTANNGAEVPASVIANAIRSFSLLLSQLAAHRPASRVSRAATPLF
jgi:hypothetical protein